jgi:cell division protein FtsW
VGLGFGTQKLQKLPEPHTDFIFAVIGEEIGLIGTVGLVILFAVFFVCSVRISMAIEDKFGKLLAIGLGMLITLQAIINIGVTTGLLPTTGMPLPLVSYGGSSFLGTMIAGGILLNISRYREQSK